MNNTELIANINALLSIDAAGALVPHGLGGHAKTLLKAAADALEAAQPAGEPLAWCQLSIGGKSIAYFDGKPIIMTGKVGNDCHQTPLYTHPPAPQVPMTADDIERLVSEKGLRWFFENYSTTFNDIIRAVEAHHKIGVKP